MPLVIKPTELDTDYLVESAYNKIFEDYTPKFLPVKRYEVVKISNDKLTVKLVDKIQGDLLCVINGTIKTYNNIEYYEIDSAYSKIERKGYLTYLIEILVYELNYKVLSDGLQSSPGSKEFWQAQMRRKKFTVYRLDLDSNFKRNANSFPEHKIWSKATRNDIDPIIDVTEYSNEDAWIDGSESQIFINNEFVEDEEMLDFNELSTEEVLGDFEDNSKSFRRIRLVAQKYVD